MNAARSDAPGQTLTAFLPIRDAAAAAEMLAADPETWLPEPALAVGPGAWVIRLFAGRTSHTVVCDLGPITQHSGGSWRTLAWQASDPTGRARVVDRAFPRFFGEIGLVRTPGPTLVLSGAYEPPGGTFGAALDRAGLERVANMSGRRLLTDIAARVRETAEIDA